MPSVNFRVPVGTRLDSDLITGVMEHALTSARRSLPGCTLSAPYLAGESADALDIRADMIAAPTDA
jgi:hypothetical protein